MGGHQRVRSRDGFQEARFPKTHKQGLEEVGSSGNALASQDAWGYLCGESQAPFQAVHPGYIPQPAAGLSRSPGLGQGGSAEACETGDNVRGKVLGRPPAPLQGQNHPWGGGSDQAPMGREGAQASK
ncbi:Hypothetical predicted protein [Marmota monax]|uniref:Uncharacterized protein n=1 Tax=Marmota monax TaxID=9995 RepID=A0A5E4B2R8_MARMO|nr:hypothetical protein GHT09_010203 [Marmota monax]VTJ62942.1 Hypothetical predicted protein [Marmota monax]